MKPIDPNIPELEFRIYAKDQPEYLQLPTRVDEEGVVVSCWQLSWKERWQMLWRGKFYLTMLTFNTPLQPVRLDLERPKIDREAIGE